MLAQLVAQARDIANGQYNRRKLILQEIELRILYFHCIVAGGN